MQRADLLEKTPMLGKIEGKRRRGWQRIRCVDDITYSKTWIWANSGSWWWTGKPGVLQSMGSQSQTWLSNWSEVNWCIHIYNTKIYLQFSSVISKKKWKGGYFSFSMEFRWAILSDFKTNSEKFQNELSGENMQRPSYVLLFLPFMIHESRGSCYRHKLMKLDNLFIFNKKKWLMPHISSF